MFAGTITYLLEKIIESLIISFLLGIIFLCFAKGKRIKTFLSVFIVSTALFGGMFLIHFVCVSVFFFLFPETNIYTLRAYMSIFLIIVLSILLLIYRYHYK